MRRQLFCLVLTVVVLALAGRASADLVGYWKLDEGSGTTASDSSGNGNDGQLVGSPAWPTGVFGGAPHFPPSPDTVVVPHGSLPTPDGALPACVLAHHYPTRTGHRSPIT